MTGTGNYKVQDVETRRVYVSRDVIFEEGLPRRSLPGVGEHTLFDSMVNVPPANTVTMDTEPATINDLGPDP